MSLAFNGKFLSASPTGVHRVAAELIMGLDRILQTDGDLARRYDAVILAPRNAQRRLPLSAIDTKLVGRLTGQLWEQFDLPFHTEGRLLVNLCNLGPVATGWAVSMIHDAQVHLTPGSYSVAFRHFYRLVQPMMGARHRRILTVSEFSKDALSKAGVVRRDKTSVVHNGVDHATHAEADESVLAQLQLEAQGYVLALANTQLHKNIKVLLQAFSDPALAPLRLVLFGGATEKDFEDAGHTVPSGTVFTGEVSDAVLRGLMENALCLAFPSTTEGFGLPPLEAMQLGCPAVVAPCGALPEACGDAVLYVDPHVPDAWCAAILRLAQDRSERAKLSQAGTDRAKLFTWDKAAMRLVGILDAVCSEGARAR